MFGVHQKLYLQKQDLRYLRKKLANKAYEKIALNLPQGDANDAVQIKVRKLVEKFIENSLELTRYSLVIDDKELGSKDLLRKVIGKLESAPVEEEEEVAPFDFELNEKLRKAYYNVEELTTQVTQKRAQIPVGFRRSIESKGSEFLEQVEQLKRRIDKEEDEENEDQQDNKQDVKRPRIVDSGVLQDYSESLEILNDVKRLLGERGDGLKKLEDLADFLE